MQLDMQEVEEICKTLYVQALKILPADIKAGFKELVRTETDATGRSILDTMIENIAVAERTKNILCQDTGIPIYNANSRYAPRSCTPLRGRITRPPAASGCRSFMSISTNSRRRCRSR